jgi:DnaJ-class molecular chaperone
MVATCALDPSSTQELIVGGAVVSSVAAALILGFQKEKEVCTSCNGSGGVVCFACEGTGIMERTESPEVEKEIRRANLGRNAGRLECRACKGVGRLLCKKCGGSGYC